MVIINIYCNDCKNKTICNVYENIIKYSAFLDLKINKCEFSIKNKIVLNNHSISNILDNNKKEVDREKINELSNKFRKDKEEKISKEKNTIKTKVNLSLAPKKIKLDSICNNCKTTTFKEDIMHCSNCQKEICSACATINSEDKSILCPECWMKL